MNTEDTDGTEVPFLYFPVVSGSATNLVLSVVEKKKGRHPHFGVFSYLIGVFPQKNNIKLGKLHDKWEIIL